MIAYPHLATFIDFSHHMWTDQTGSHQHLNQLPNALLNTRVAELDTLNIHPQRKAERKQRLLEYQSVWGSGARRIPLGAILDSSGVATADPQEAGRLLADHVGPRSHWRSI
eukprot:732997-Pyramimonas_sp.AAC.2